MAVQGLHHGVIDPNYGSAAFDRLAAASGLLFLVSLRWLEAEMQPPSSRYRLFAIGESDVVTAWCAGVELTRTANLHGWVCNHFSPVADPANSTS